MYNQGQLDNINKSKNKHLFVVKVSLAVFQGCTYFALFFPSDSKFKSVFISGVFLWKGSSVLIAGPLPDAVCRRTWPRRSTCSCTWLGQVIVITSGVGKPINTWIPGEHPGRKQAPTTQRPAACTADPLATAFSQPWWAGNMSKRRKWQNINIMSARRHRASDVKPLDP